MPSLARRLDALPRLRDALWDLEAAVLDRAWRAAAARDPDAASELGWRLGRRLGPLSHKHKHVLANLRIAFPGWLPQRVDAVAREIWGSIGRTLIEYPLLERICDPAEGRVRVVDLGGLEAIRRSGRPGIFVSAHVGNWNLLPLAAVRSDLPLSVVYRRQSNPLIERLMGRWRATLPCTFLEVDEATRPLLRELQRGCSVGLVMDQRYDRGAKVPFFGVPATTTPIPARLAVRLGLPLVPAQVRRLRGARFAVLIHRPIPAPADLDGEATALAMTAAINEQFARWITGAPEQWQCAKRRWPRQRFRIPKGGKVSLT
jgi:KDO2-lipid IV(A) lauroyltransferase